MNLRLPSLDGLWAFIVKWGSPAVAAYGINTHNLRDMTVGSVLTAVLHGYDSIFNSPKAAKP